jgi:CO/xanthine dehydrogenase FAD-binding subunit
MKFNVISPKTKTDLLKAMKNETYFRFGAGYTDLIPEMKKMEDIGYSIINLAQLNDQTFRNIKRGQDVIRIGTLATAAQIVNDEFIAENFPVLHQAANCLASSQIRQVATVGGNLCTASPSGDISCALVSIQAQCEILSESGNLRLIPIADFFIGPRKTSMKNNEILRSVIVPINVKHHEVHSGFLKVGTRRSMECSVVSLAYHILTDKKAIIHKAGIAIGAVAPTIRYAEEAGNFLLGKNISSIHPDDSELFANEVLKYASPISDLRASAWYRSEVLFNISKSILE